MTKTRQTLPLFALPLLLPAACFHDTGLELPDANQPNGSQKDGSVDVDFSYPNPDGSTVDVGNIDVNRPDRDYVDVGEVLRIAFSRGGGQGNLGGLVGADNLCQAGYPSGIWKAWLSDSTTNAIDRITADGPWYTLDGHLAFANKAQLAETPSAIIDVDQFGGVVAASSYWTGTEIGGTKSAENCSDWTSASPDVKGGWGDGRQQRGAGTWTAAGTTICQQYINLLCIQVNVP